MLDRKTVLPQSFVDSDAAILHDPESLRGLGYVPFTEVLHPTQDIECVTDTEGNLWCVAE